MRLVHLGLLTALALAPAAAQAQAKAADVPGQNPRAVQMTALEHQRQFLLQMADSMPERLYADKATPAQRSFTEQVQHAAGAVPFVTAMALKGPKPALPDTATASTRAGLKAYINASFDYAANLLKNQTAESRASTVSLFGKSMPGWQVWDEIHTHTVWTAGQIVANFRKNGMAPPSFTFF